MLKLSYSNRYLSQPKLNNYIPPSEEKESKFTDTDF